MFTIIYELIHIPYTFVLQHNTYGEKLKLHQDRKATHM